MPKHLPARALTFVTALLAFLLMPEIILAETWRLVGLTGMQNDQTQDAQGEYVHPDRTLFEINPIDGAINKLFQVTFVTDGHAIGYCPTNGLVYHAAGDESWNNNPQRVGSNQGVPDIVGVGYMDSQYLETVNLTTRALNAVYNANPCPNPDSTLPCYGLPAPRPSWVLPVVPRDSTQTDLSYQARGTNEYHELRGFAWSTNKNLFYISDAQGIFKLTPGGDCTFLSQPAFTIDNKNNAAKAIAFVTVTNVTKLLVGHRDGSGANGYLMEVDLDTGAVLGDLALTYPPGGGDPIDAFGGLLALAQHPVTGVLYGIRNTTDHFARELVTINPVTGATTLVASLGMHITSMAFIPLPPFQIQSITRNGNNLTLTWSGAKPPYQLQTRADLSISPWTNIGASTTNLSATITNAISGPQGYFRVSGQ